MGNKKQVRLKTLSSYVIDTAQMSRYTGVAQQPKRLTTTRDTQTYKDMMIKHTTDIILHGELKLDLQYTDQSIAEFYA